MLRIISQRSVLVAKNVSKSGSWRALSTTSPSQALSKFTMPSMSPTMTEGGISSWKLKEGDSFSAGDILLEIETDKATMDVEAQDDGVLGKILVEGGSKNVQVGTTIAILAEPGDELSGSEMDSLVSEAKSSKPASSPKKEESSPPPKSDPTPAPATKEEPQKAPESSKPKDVIFASPLAKKLAQEKGIPLSKVKGSGPGGRIVKADIDSYKPSESSSAASISAASSTPVYTDIPLSNMRRVIGQRLLQSKVEIPHYYLTAEINMDRIIKLREVFNSAATAKEGGKDGVKADTKLSVNDFIVKGAALAMKDVPEVNSGWFGDFIRQYHTVDISVAVATPTGLITPIIHDVGSKGLASISSTTKALAVKARDGKLQPSEYQGGSFTISNLGMFGSISHFTAIVNPPQSCILAIGGTEKKLVEDPTEEKGFKSVNSMKVTLSCDHRVVDGAVGARWLKAFKDYMENPLTFML